MVVAIVAVFSAIAVPSFFSIQNNMRISELDSTAEQIAQAAQNQMTAKKVNGTWVEMLDELGIVENADTQRAIGLPSGVADSDDIYYVTAEQARKQGILPQNAIEESVYKGDYVIEFSKSTATVCSVFYTDGKSGYFDGSSLPSGSHPALSYYEANGSRAREARMVAKPVIGYYQGTPAGATNTVILANPIIWSDDFGNLCIENPNLKGSQTWAKNSATAFTVTRMVGGAESTTAFTVKGLQQNGLGFYTVSINDQSSTQMTNGNEITLVTRDDADTQAANFTIDLASILSKMQAAGGDYAVVAGQFSNTDDLRIDASITTTGVAYEPSKAFAYMKFPAPTAKVMVLVTDPSKLSGTDTYTGTHIDASNYAKPTVKALTYSGATSTKAATVAGEIDVLTGTSSALYSKTATYGNPAAAYQAYTGGYLNLSESEADNTLYLQAKVGAYGTHQYQIFEMWINDTKVGYLYDNKWVWSYAALANKISIASDSATDMVTSVNVATYGFAALCSSAGVPATSEGAYHLYIRTMPRLSEVSQYVNTTSFYNAVVSAVGTSSAAGRTTTLSTSIRGAFEREFGAPSSVASWTVTRTNSSGMTGYPVSAGDIRIYYAGTPAFGFETAPVTDAIMKKQAYAVENAALWYAKASGGTYALQAGTAMVRTAPDGTKYYMSSLGNTDFALPYTSDSLFYRAMFYYNDSGTYIGTVRYVPYSYNNDTNVASFMTMTDKSPSQVFMGWTTSNTRSGTAMTCARGSVVGTYDSQLAFGRINLTAKYGEVKVIGLIYFEKYSNNTYGYYGYRSVNGDMEFIDTLDYTNTKTISDWGYRVIVPQGYLASLKSSGGYSSVILYMDDVSKALSFAQTLTISGSSYDSYTLRFNSTDASYMTQAYTFGINADWNYLRTADYSFNVNLAKAVAQGTSMKNLWGSAGYPWSVRDGDQFFGTFAGADGSKYLQDKGYMDDSYLQERDIDLSSNTVLYRTYWYSGTYDGGTYKIKGYKPGITQAWDKYCTGLFASVSDATLKDIKLTDLRSPGTINFSNNDSYFGILAGRSTNSTIKNCSIDCIQGTQLMSVELGSSSTFWASLYIGGLVGYMSNNTTIESCTFKNVEITNSISLSIGHTVTFGGLVGYAGGSNSKMTRESGVTTSSVQNVTFVKSSGISILGTEYYGGCIGYADNKASFSNLSNKWYSSVKRKYYSLFQWREETITKAIGNG